VRECASALCFPRHTCMHQKQYTSICVQYVYIHTHARIKVCLLINEMFTFTLTHPSHIHNPHTPTCSCMTRVWQPLREIAHVTMLTLVTPRPPTPSTVRAARRSPCIRVGRQRRYRAQPLTYPVRLTSQPPTAPDTKSRGALDFLPRRDPTDPATRRCDPARA
jgi:hypothetical protein